MKAYEKLGAFYLGRSHDLASGKTTDETLLYDSKDLLTHAVCVGMTGSGKTGLCVSLLEEAAIDGIPALVIDPKGDLTNLMLTFPDLDAASFRPWINEDEARQKGITPDAFAAKQAQLWRDGLAAWDQDGERIQRLKDAADFAIYTPGSNAGLPVSILSSFAAPPPELMDDLELVSERTSTVVTSVLSLLGIDADPIRSREHILLSTLLQHAWTQGTSVDIGALIQMIQNPPVTRIGVLELESFYPSRDRFELAMLLNNLLASPRFQMWMTGEPIDVDKLLYTPAGKPRIAIFSIAHLDDTERMFFVSLLLNQALSWTRSRPGTTSLRALIYMDEIFGYMPPVSNPPSKRPLLTMLKQARAHGVGLVLATQNPVDLDYKGLSNTGTWFIGRLQTERDKARVLDGLKGIAAGADSGFDPDALDETINQLGKRVFLMHNVHENAPVVFHTRWAMSYLAGPMTRTQITAVTQARTATTAAGTTPGATKTAAAPAAAGPPVLDPTIPQGFIRSRGAAGPGELAYEPGVIGVARVHFVPRGGGKSHTQDVSLVLPLDADTRDVDWPAATETDLTADDIEAAPVTGAAFAGLPGAAGDPRSYARWEKAFADTLYRNRRVPIYTSGLFKLSSEPGEDERDFRIRLAVAARETRDEQVEKLRKKYATRFSRLDERIRRAEQTVEREKDDVQSTRVQTAVSVGATILSAFLGRKATSRATLGRATTAVRGVGRTAKQAGDVGRAKANMEALIKEREELNARFEADLDQLEDRLDPMSEELTVTELKPRRTDVEVKRVALAWLPVRRSAAGGRDPLWR